MSSSYVGCHSFDSSIMVKSPFTFRKGSKEKPFYTNEFIVPISMDKFWSMMMNPKLRLLILQEDVDSVKKIDDSTIGNNELLIFKDNINTTLEVWNKTELMDNTIHILTQTTYTEFFTTSENPLDYKNNSPSDNSTKITLKCMFEWTLTRISSNETKVLRKGITIEHCSWLPFGFIVPRAAKEEDKNLIEKAIPQVKNYV